MRAEESSATSYEDVHRRRDKIYNFQYAILNNIKYQCQCGMSSRSSHGSVLWPFNSKFKFELSLFVNCILQIVHLPNLYFHCMPSSGKMGVQNTVRRIVSYSICSWFSSLSLILIAKLDWSSVSQSSFGNTDNKDQLKNSTHCGSGEQRRSYSVHSLYRR